MSIIIKNKKEIRKYLKNILKELNYNKILEDSLKCQFKILHSSLYKQSNSICCYISMLNELQTNKLIQYALNDLKKVYIPKIIGSNRYDMELHEITSIEQIQNFPKSKWGIPEPPDDAICSIDYANYIDIVFVPGVAFDNQCKRLGHGKGYYDTFLTLLTQKCHELGRDKPPFVGLAFDEQILESVPVESYDVVLDYVVTPSSEYSRSQSDGISSFQNPFTLSSSISESLQDES